MEKDVEASEKRERQLKEKVEGLGFEVDEWKVCITSILWWSNNLAHGLHANGVQIVKIQAIQSRSEFSPEHAPERDYDLERYQ